MGISGKPWYEWPVEERAEHLQKIVNGLEINLHNQMRRTDDQRGLYEKATQQAEKVEARLRTLETKAREVVIKWRTGVVPFEHVISELEAILPADPKSGGESKEGGAKGK